MSGCGNCSGGCEGCSGCSGCGGALTLHPGEVKILELLAQFPFLPVARKADDMTPFYPEGSEYPQEEYSLILQSLEKKQLISIDYDAPLKGCGDNAYGNYPVRGSFALTARGQQVLELLDIQGAE
jgi:hypothetical protein